MLIAPHYRHLATKRQPLVRSDPLPPGIDTVQLRHVHNHGLQARESRAPINFCHAHLPSESRKHASGQTPLLDPKSPNRFQHLQPPHEPHTLVPPNRYPSPPTAPEGADRNPYRAPFADQSAAALQNCATAHQETEHAPAPAGAETSTLRSACQPRRNRESTSEPAPDPESAQARTSFRFVSQNHDTTARITGSPNSTLSSASGSPSQPRCQTTWPRQVAGTQKI
jgi:hypothetical protein